MHQISDLNRHIRDYKITQMIHIEEALHEKKIAYIADMIHQKKNARIVLIAGPSSSGKTTFAKRLSIQLRVNGLIPLVIGMDNYFLSRDQTPRKSDGEYDFESIRAIDVAKLNEHLRQLLAGETIELPQYDFIRGIQEPSGKTLTMRENNVVIMEGIHGLNDELTVTVPAEQKFKIYISCLNQLNLDDHNRIPTTDTRKIRRIVRDAQYRNYSAEDTLKRWQSIREGEDRNIFPFQENCDIMFNSGLTYELSVLKSLALPILMKVPRRSPVKPEAKRLIRLLQYFREMTDTHVVPNNSILREFCFGSIFKY
ncbi:MAG: nucleoside kinase [Candidatus Cloacimonetes bacterium]|nr:nucleoside kinase [Candidatus Cloacimonadota bacterium]